MNTKQQDGLLHGQTRPPCPTGLTGCCMDVFFGAGAAAPGKSPGHFGTNFVGRNFGSVLGLKCVLDLKCPVPLLVFQSRTHASRLIFSPFPIPVPDHMQCSRSDTCQFGHINRYLLTYLLTYLLNYLLT